VRILLTGLSHRTAPLATREALSLTRDEVPGALETLKSHVGRGVILSTCNRTEVYTVARDPEQGREALAAFFDEQFGRDSAVARQHLYTLEQDEAVTHLFRVASSLDSLIIGESEILGQVRDAFGIATRHGGAGGVLAHVFHSALRTGKRARTETELGKNALSVSRACVQLARRTLGDISNKQVLVVGVGEASRLAAIAMRDAGATAFTVANRTPEHAKELGAELRGPVASLDEMAHLIGQSDLVVSSTGAPDFAITRDLIEEATERRGDRPLLMIDMAIPRDIEPDASSLPGVTVHTMEDLGAIAEANRREREQEAGKVERIVEEETERFQHWWDSRGVTPTIANIRHRAEKVRAAEVAKTLSRLDLSPEHEERLATMTKALVKKLLHQPTKILRDRKDEAFTQNARELFGLDEE